MTLGREGSTSYEGIRDDGRGVAKGVIAGFCRVAVGVGGFCAGIRNSGCRSGGRGSIKAVAASTMLLSPVSTVGLDTTLDI